MFFPFFHPRFGSAQLPFVARARECEPTGTQLAPAPGWKGMAHGRVLRLQPLRERYRFRSNLGSGAYGIVDLLEGRSCERELVVAKVARPKEAALQAILNEVKFLSSAPRDSVHCLRGLLFRAGALCGYTAEYLAGETLELRLKRGWIEQAEALGLAAAITRSVLRLGSRGIVHRDLKPAHIYLTRDGGVKLLDLGLARRTGEKTGNQLSCTPLYAAPEQIDGQSRPIDPKIDLFSLGLILYEVVAGHSFFSQDVEGLGTFFRARRERMKQPLLLPVDCPGKLAEVISRLLVDDPEERAGAEEVEGMLWGGGRSNPLRAGAPKHRYWTGPGV